MKMKRFLVMILFSMMFYGSPNALAQGNAEMSMTAKDAAEHIYATISAGRQFYSDKIVARLGEAGVVHASENWQMDDSLPLPAQFLALSAKEANDYGIGLKIRLIGLTPINKENGPVSDLETHALQNLSSDPGKPFTWLSQNGSSWSFQAIYPDVAKLDSCVSCHNQHPKSAKHDWKKGDVMGGVLIRLPLTSAPLLEKGMAAEDDLMTVSAPIVSDYLHTILRSNRTVYAKHVVKPLSEKKVVKAQENWMETNTLPLPAQFLKETSSLAKKLKRGLNFRLISLWPINFSNAPGNEFERKALISVADDPLRPYFGQFKRGRFQYFQAIYPDFAVSPSCVSCHNNHASSPKTDFQLDDMMGGIVVSFPVKK